MLKSQNTHKLYKLIQPPVVPAVSHQLYPTCELSCLTRSESTIYSYPNNILVNVFSISHIIMFHCQFHI